ncbi:polysaccharide deacetylase family sporulation protein PdaB [Paenibacillus lutrae]|uniref:Polysaccharide deacetylase family sporulation protein PdaB n=1 Tax=Paenibacillus lutrae TaxID=2078573 RepID=A0A7X3FM05_9BACL|nr:polysaccharide deacetylase family sporulation protein PdaB [Paenibacillus lutrae]
MSHFYVYSGKKMKQTVFITVAVMFAAGIVYSERENMTVFSSGAPAAIYNVKTEKKQIALTFDISWGEVRTDPILDILEQKGVKNATFFLSSPWSKSHPDTVNRIVKSGYEIGSHGHKHVNYSSLGDEEIRKQIQTAHGVLEDITGKAPNLIRLPNGDFDKRVLSIADQLGYRVIQWDTDSLDWKNPGVDQIINRVVNKAHPGDIVLLHASDSCKQTHEALPAIIEQLRSKGYEFVTVSELMKQAQTENKPVEEKSFKQVY